MYVQPYFPEPVEVPGNVANVSFERRLQFIKRVYAFYAVTVLLVIAFCHLVPPIFGLVPTLVACACALVLLSAVRNIAPKRVDGWLSTGLLLAFLPLVGQSLGYAQRAGFPIWIVWVGIGLALIYAGLSGRDFSFGGQYVLVAIALVLMTLGLIWFAQFHWFLVVEGLVTFLVYFGFVSYNLSCLMRRRTPDEVPSATADLYRDVLNFVTWFFRVYHHWKRFRFI